MLEGFLANGANNSEEFSSAILSILSMFYLSIHSIHFLFKALSIGYNLT